MRAVVVTEFGGPEMLRIHDIADPVPGVGEILVDVQAAGVNFVDVYRRRGAYGGELPFVAGMEGAGRIAELGQGVRGLAPGDLVGWVNRPGSYAERIVVPADRAVRLPPDVDAEQAAAVLLQGMTAHYLVHDIGRVGPGVTVLVHAAAGGVGLLATQMAVHAGGRVIGTVSTEEKVGLARSAGAHDVIRRDVDDVAAAVAGVTDGGVDVVLDGIGGPTFDAGLAVLRPRGVLVIFGQAGGPVPPVDVQRLNRAGSVFLTRPNLDHYIGTADELARRAAAVLDMERDGVLVVHPRARYPLSEADAAHADLESGGTVGKLVLRI